MENFKTWQEMLQKTRYITRDQYQGKSIYPNTGSVDADWQVLLYTIEILNNAIKTNSIEEYFYYLNFSIGQANLFGIEAVEKKHPPIYQHPIVETNNFVVRGNIGSIVPGYNLIIPKQHILSMSSLPEEMLPEYIELLQRMRTLYEKIYQRKPIIFEHGTNFLEKNTAGSIVHSHTHIVNHHYSDEQSVISSLGLEEVSSIEDILREGQEKNYISYISPSDRYYIGDASGTASQAMRRFIAQDIGKPDEWNWRKYPYLENSFETAKQYVLHQQKGAK